ncbi:methyltransferase-domain-containing protein [Jimgerdemannia flammicorona]|uniref:Ribosomal RNA-processing protein 8 n=1 Tax=Jimgerdemannia flammicorona TaxID=994334 RepID=A0A433DAC0_9FUNG|nr:methyltransferase-domain-containing protein [Jimgerdemannia flammicorona]
MLFEVDWNIGTFVPDKPPQQPRSQKNKSDATEARTARPLAGKPAPAPSPHRGQQQQKRKRSQPEPPPGATEDGDAGAKKSKRHKKDRKPEQPVAEVIKDTPRFVSVLTAPEDERGSGAAVAGLQPVREKKERRDEAPKKTDGKKQKQGKKDVEDAVIVQDATPKRVGNKKRKKGKKDIVATADTTASPVAIFEAATEQIGTKRQKDNKRAAADVTSTPVAAREAKAAAAQPGASNGTSQDQPSAHKKLSKREKQKLKAALARTSAAEAKLKLSTHQMLQPSATSDIKDKLLEKEPSGLTSLQQRMRKKLSGARFRWLNEQLYTTSGNKSFELFREKPEMFEEVRRPFQSVPFYHAGFRSQVSSWPTNPVDVLIENLRTKPTDTTIADLGCGDAKIASVLAKHKVLSFDLVARNDKVVACDIAKVPLPPKFVDVAVFCLSLMGTNYIDFLTEASRILKPNGELKIAEVVSRFSDVDAFVDVLSAIGFDLVSKDDSNTMFILFDFVKRAGADGDGSKKHGDGKGKGGAAGGTLPQALRKAEELLKPCLYKKR